MLKNKCALVTGSVAGLGFALANRLASEGANVIINGLCDGAEGVDAAARITEEHGVGAVYDGADLSVVAEIERMMAAVTERFGGVDILINNAVVRNFSLVEDLRPEQWDKSIAVNLTGAFHTVRLAVPGMKARGWGRIINMSSAFGQRGAVGRVDYVTTKTALIGLTRAVAVETAETGITCNALAPGVVPTDAITGKIAGMAADQGQPVADVEREYLLSRHPTARFVAMESVAATAVFLCSSAGADITGAVFPVDGGWTSR